MRRLAVAFWLVLPLYIHADYAEPMPAPELAAFLGPVPSGAITWTKYLGSKGVYNFSVYYGTANEPLSGELGFFLGGWRPMLEPARGSKIVKGKLGIFPVRWHRKTQDDGVTQSALIRLDKHWRVKIWIRAHRRQDMDKLLSIIARLPTFTKKPNTVPQQ